MMISESAINKGLSNARMMFRQMPEYVLNYLVKQMIKNGVLPDRMVGLSHSPTGTSWDDFCAPYSTLDVAWMRWDKRPINVSRSDLDEITIANLDSCMEETINGKESIHQFCRQKIRGYLDYVRTCHTIPGNPLIAFQVGNKYHLLNGCLRVASAFMAGQSVFSIEAWVGMPTDISEQRKVLISTCSEAQKIVTEYEKNAMCMHPECETLAIGSHSQQEHGQLDCVAEGNQVYVLERDHVKSIAPYFFHAQSPLPRLVKKNVSKATVFLGYCNEHDTSVFSCIERSELVKDSPNQVVAFHIRALSYTFARQRHELYFSMKLWELMSDKIGCMQPNPQIINWRIYVPADYEMLIKPCFQPGAANNLRWVWRIIDKNIGVSCTSSICPLDDESGDKYVGDATDYKKLKLTKPRPFASLAVLPKDDCTHVVLVWHKDISDVAKDYIDAFASNDIAKFEMVLNDAIFNRSEDYAVRPSLWESLSEDERTKFEVAIIPEHLRGDLPDKPSLIKLNGCSIT